MKTKGNVKRAEQWEKMKRERRAKKEVRNVVEERTAGDWGESRKKINRKRDAE